MIGREELSCLEDPVETSKGVVYWRLEMTAEEIAEKFCFGISSPNSVWWKNGRRQGLIL